MTKKKRERRSCEWCKKTTSPVRTRRGAAMQGQRVCDRCWKEEQFLTRLGRY